MDARPTIAPAIPSVGPAASAHTARGVPTSVPGARLRGPWLVPARLVGVVLVAVPIALFVVALPPALDQLHQTALAATLALRRPGQPAAPALLRAALAPGVYASTVLALECALMAANGVAAVAIFARRSADWMAIFAAVALVNFAALASPALSALAAARPTWAFPVAFAQAVGLECALLIFYLSPDGRFVPRWTVPLAVVWTAWRTVALLFPAARSSFVGPHAHEPVPFAPAFVAFLLWVGWLGSAIAAQVERFRRVSSPEQRQQTKWAMVGATAAVIGYVAFVLPRLTVPWLARPGPAASLDYALGLPLYLLLLLAVPLCVAFSVLRHRLWGVDLLISRALLYSTLTLALAGVYACCVLVVETLMRALTGQESALAQAVSTLAVAACFQPLLHRLQSGIDRRFARRRYDAARTLQAFATTLRSEVDLERLCADLLAVIEGTMQPEHIWLWLRSPAAAGQRPPGGEEKVGMGAAGRIRTDNH